MIHFTDIARQHLECYLQQVRHCLKSRGSVDGEEVEQNIREHIESEFCEATEPVSLEALEAILQKLGSPERWVPEEDIVWWRKLLLRLHKGPEDWRLAYLSFSILVLSLLMIFNNQTLISLLFLGISFIFSRAGLSEGYGDVAPRSQKWLLYPSLLLVYGVVLFILFFWPIPVLYELAERFEQMRRDAFPWKTEPFQAFWCFAYVGITAAMSVWCLILALAYIKANRLFCAVFHPFCQIAGRRWVKWFIIIASLVFVVSSAAAFLMMAHPGWCVCLEGLGG